ncbi:uncharacterized protein YpbB [Virgibacillus natechei]|uniref:Uncharacterized protein YpbB n=1 Tax=Virgibacillus natechei TaxID=1216297 RepID=A0ABS4IFK9_9BACI|nr:helix-turn-helix domain-containing protein [Virgibacillus natechei]MBP1969638.1 uncharacterized protein YpbB [Virgibacillus natechei]UZD11366.1 helix-turn-helix domain-containing protein [Virgibacillus natechei]
MLLEGIILYCSSQIGTERTGASIYHLLNGKKSIQTVQDAHVYNLTSFYGVHKRLSQQRFNAIIRELMTYDRLQKTSTTLIYTPTIAGEDWLHKHKPNLPFNYYNGLKYHDTGTIFLDRLTLLIQTLTNSKMNYFTFIPVIDKLPIENWVKSFYIKMKPHEPKLLPVIYKELHILLQNLSDQEAELFIDRLTGFKNYGMSITQLADTYKFSPDDVQLMLVAITHRMFETIENNNNFPILGLVIKDLVNTTLLTNSAATTYNLLQKKHSIDEISRIRNLKSNTIYDHIVEIALYDVDFSIINYVSEESQLDITNAVTEANSYKLRDIMQLVDEEISYFQIRLVLAKAKKFLK